MYYRVVGEFFKYSKILYHFRLVTVNIGNVLECVDLHLLSINQLMHATTQCYRANYEILYTHDYSVCKQSLWQLIITGK